MPVTIEISGFAAPAPSAPRCSTCPQGARHTCRSHGCSVLRSISIRVGHVHPVLTGIWTVVTAQPCPGFCHQTCPPDLACRPLWPRACWRAFPCLCSLCTQPARSWKAIGSWMLSASQPLRSALQQRLPACASRLPWASSALWLASSRMHSHLYPEPKDPILLYTSRLSGGVVVYVLSYVVWPGARVGGGVCVCARACVCVCVCVCPLCMGLLNFVARMLSYARCCCHLVAPHGAAAHAAARHVASVSEAGVRAFPSCCWRAPKGRLCGGSLHLLRMHLAGDLHRCYSLVWATCLQVCFLAVWVEPAHSVVIALQLV